MLQRCLKWKNLLLTSLFLSVLVTGCQSPGVVQTPDSGNSQVGPAVPNSKNSRETGPQSPDAGASLQETAPTQAPPLRVTAVKPLIMKNFPPRGRLGSYRDRLILSTRQRAFWQNNKESYAP